MAYGCFLCEVPDQQVDNDGEEKVETNPLYPGGDTAHGCGEIKILVKA